MKKCLMVFYALLMIAALCFIPMGKVYAAVQ